jgi:hypothetical protein
MKSFLSRFLGVGLPASIIAACSSSPGTVSDAGPPQEASHVDAGPPPCDDSKCYSGNKCLPDATGNVSCQLPCNLQYGQTPQAGQTALACPFNYTCTDFPAGTPSGSADRAYCTPNKNPFKAATGQFGTPCDPTGGIEKNPACDSADNFWCFATSPSDGNAFCTQMFFSSSSTPNPPYCTDADCPGGWWCATANLGPNAQSNTRTTGTVYSYCAPRNYCSSCQSDIDCDATNGIQEHCIADRLGTNYCAPVCTKDDNCNTDAQCITLDQTKLCADGGGQACVCAARARECTGDGKLCSPCQSDADCKPGGGLCLTADYSTEHFCGVPSGATNPVCSVNETSGALTADCPMTDEAPNSPNISCLTTYDAYDPPNQCVGLVTFGTDSDTGQPQYIIGCWTPNRPNG